MPLACTEICATPGATEVTNPFASTIATSGLLLVQIVVLFAPFTVAFNCTVLVDVPP